MVRAGSITSDLLREDTHSVPCEVPELGEVGVGLNRPVEFREDELCDGLQQILCRPKRQCGVIVCLL